MRLAAGLALTVLGALFALAFYYRYWIWRDCFNELGRCYDPETQQVYLEQAGIAWGTLAVVALAAGVFMIVRGRRRG
ncbi:MAG: hypothetical protein WDM94_14770 [Bauldia sp.]